MTSPARLEVLRQGLEATAEEMGEVLARAAFSPNIKERRDHSCAVFSSQGEPVAQAEHIPVHLGAMPHAVHGVRAVLGELDDGDVALVNDPQHGGTHLPDLTMVAPVHHQGQRVAYLAARAHHADVGGTSPGSMPAGARSLEEEGIVIPPVRIVRSGTWVDEVLDRVLESTRDPRERRGDLVAQRGALTVGARRVQELCHRHGSGELASGIAGILDHTEALVRARLTQRAPGTYQGEEHLEDDGTGQGPFRLCLEATLGDQELSLDYTGTDPQLSGNLNAPLPVTLAGVLYVARVLLGPEIPANAGWNRVLGLHVPEGCLLNPAPGAAVAGGNVETSQRNVDLLLATLKPAFTETVPAQSQGTMNNVSLGGGRPDGSRFTFYETVGGGEGATPTRPGQSGVHTHMTNTRTTPVEALEHAMPLRVDATTLRRGTGGHGLHPGGDGILRALEALVDGVEVNLITTRRTRGPRGLDGGGDGASGRNSLRRADGSVEPLTGIDDLVLDAGDVLVVETPGGGGWGQR